MANWTILKAAIADIIKTNGNQEITGQLLQNVLNNIVSSVGENATFAGIAIPTTNPGAPDGPVFYLAATAGIYPNFNGNEVLGGEAAILLWNNGAWSKKVTGFATQKKLTELEYYAGVQSDLNVTFEDKADGSIDVVFNKRVIFIKNGHRGFNLTFDSYPQTFNVPIYYTLAMNVETREVALQTANDGIEVQNNLILLHNEPKGVFNGVFAMLYNTTKINTSLNDFIQYKNIDKGGSAISPYSSISIRKGDGSNLIVKFSAARYNMVDDYGNNPNFTIDAGTELIVPNYGAIFADIASRKIILSNNYYARASKQILLAYNEGGVMLSGLLKGLYDKTFNDAPVIIKAERDFVDITYSQKINNAWVSATNVENRNDINFDLYYYSIDSHTSKVQLYNATGGGHTIFLDADGNVLLTHQSSPQYQSAWYEYDVPQGTTMIKVTHAKWQEKYPYAFPLRVRANHQAYTNDNLLNLTGKKVVFFGDSITEMGYYVNAFQKMTGCNVVKRGVSGTSFTKTTGRGYEDSLSERIDLPSSDAVGNKLGLPSEADLVIVLAGVNDWGQRNNWDIDLGSMTAAIDKTNFTGAVKYVFSKLREKYPTTPIVVLSMLHVYHPTSFGTWREIAYSDGQYGGEITYLTDKDGNTMDVWRKRVGEAANFYGIPFVNMTQCGFTPFLQSDNETFMPDGLHPSEEGGEIMAKYITAQIKSLIS